MYDRDPLYKLIKMRMRVIMLKKMKREKVKGVPPSIKARLMKAVYLHPVCEHARRHRG